MEANFNPTLSGDARMQPWNQSGRVDPFMVLADTAESLQQAANARALKASPYPPSGPMIGYGGLQDSFDWPSLATTHTPIRALDYLPLPTASHSDLTWLGMLLAGRDG